MKRYYEEVIGIDVHYPEWGRPRNGDLYRYENKKWARYSRVGGWDDCPPPDDKTLIGIDEQRAIDLQSMSPEPRFRFGLIGKHGYDRGLR